MMKGESRLHRRNLFNDPLTNSCSTRVHFRLLTRPFFEIISSNVIPDVIFYVRLSQYYLLLTSKILENQLLLSQIFPSPQIFL